MCKTWKLVLHSSENRNRSHKTCILPYCTGCTGFASFPYTHAKGNKCKYRCKAQLSVNFSFDRKYGKLKRRKTFFFFFFFYNSKHFRARSDLNQRRFETVDLNLPYPQIGIKLVAFWIYYTSIRRKFCFMQLPKAQFKRQPKQMLFYFDQICSSI